jgi:hypothetical protein
MSLEDDVMRDSFEPTADDMRFGARVIADRTTVPALQTASAGEVTLTADEDALIEVLRSSHVTDPKVLDESKPYFWPAEISSARLDSYDTRMDPKTTLPNFAADAIEGVAFCDSHNHNQMNFGRSFAGLFVDGTAVETDSGQPGQTPARVFAAFYTFPGLQLSNVTTDNLIKGIRTGLVKDVSVGFKPGQGFMYRCSVCGRDLWDWDCPHIPGTTESVVTNEATGATEERYVFSWIDNARLSEVSAVYDGATPKAMILKAARMARAGVIKESAARFVEQLARINLPGKRPFLPGDSTGERTMADDKKVDESRAALTASEASVRSVLKTLSIKADEDVSLDDGVRLLKTEVEVLRPRAERGDKLFSKLVDEAVAEGVRAFGDKFDAEKQKRTLSKLEVEDVEAMREAWSAQAGEKIPAGRKSKDEGDESTKREESDDVETRYIDDAAFAV